MTRVLLVEDEAMVRAGLRELLDAEDGLEVAAEAADGRTAVELAAVCSPDVVVMDIRLPELDGIEATRRICAASTAPAVLLLTTFSSEQYLFDGLRAGASGFFLKSATPEQLAEAIRTVARGDSVVSPKMMRSLIAHVVTEEPAVSSGIEALSAREREVLELVAAGYSNVEIATALVVALPTVKSHVRHILAKLNVQNRLQLIVAARAAGLGGSSEGRVPSPSLREPGQ